MIKLSKIISEIKIMGRLTPEQVDDFWSNDIDVDNPDGSYNEEKYREYVRICNKYGWFFKDEQLPSIDFLKKMPYSKLKNFYEELLQFSVLKEIKVASQGSKLVIATKVRENDSVIVYNLYFPKINVKLKEAGIKYKNSNNPNELVTDIYFEKDNYSIIKKIKKLFLSKGHDLEKDKYYAEIAWEVKIPEKFIIYQDKNLDEIKIQGSNARGYKEIKDIFPSILKYFPDAKIGYVDHPIGLTAYIYFTAKNKKSERYGDKWQITYFPFFPVPPDYKPGIYILDIDERQKNPNYYPGYGDIFPQNDNKRIFLQKLAKFFREPYQEREI